jgi:hypothetical protein
MRNRFMVMAAIVAAALALGPSPASAKELTRVIGGGVATFDDIPRLSAYFGVDAKILDAGDAHGGFTSVIVNYAVIVGNFKSGKVNGDGSLTLEGTASTFFLDGTMTQDYPYSIVVWPGAPKTARILMKTPDNGDGDYQTVSVGTLQTEKP